MGKNDLSSLVKLKHQSTSWVSKLTIFASTIIHSIKRILVSGKKMLGEICSNDPTNVKIPHLHVHKLKTAMEIWLNHQRILKK